MKTDRPLPKLDLNITNRCNFRCRHCCFASGETIPEELPLTKISTILEDFASLGGRRIDVTGGEPTLRADYFKIIAAAKTLGLAVELVTNGSLLDEHSLDRLRTIGLDAIAISLDGSTYETYARTRPVPDTTYVRVLETCRIAVRLGFPPKINTVVRRSNLADIPAISDLAIALGAKEHGLYYFTPVGRGATDRAEIAPELRWLDLIRQELSYRKNRIKLSLETPLIEDRLFSRLNAACYLERPWHLQILPDGNVYPCAIMAAAQAPCGNLHRQTLAEIWNDSKLWDRRYYETHVCPLQKQLGTCVDLGSRFRMIIRTGYRPICPDAKIQFRGGG